MRRVAIVVLLAASVIACQKTKGDEMQENLATFKQEQSPDKLFARGQGFAAIGDWTRAEEYFAAALDAGGDSHKIVPQLLVACIRGQKYRVAIQYGSNYMRVHPEDTSTRFILATLYLAVEQYGEAKENLDVVMQKEPQNADAHFALGVAFRDGDNDPVRADKEFREYLRLSPKGKHAREATGGLLHELPQPTSAPPPAMAPPTPASSAAPSSTAPSAPSAPAPPVLHTLGHVDGGVP